MPSKTKCGRIEKMPSKKQTIVISLGGSIIVPDEIRTDFLKKFKTLILKLLKKNYRFIIVTGGGKTCRKYQKAASIVSSLTDEDKDWLGVHSARLNAHLIRTIFKKQAYPVVLDSPHKTIKKKHKLFIASGWRPGWSTDYCAVLLAKRFKVKKLINASNIDYVYDKNKKDLKTISWPKYRKLIGAKRTPGMNVPFDPVASKIAQKSKIEVIILRGTNLKNTEKALTGKKFKGTIIS